ncbi:MAG: transcriptional repressor [Clostridia bacterium]|nr:transcriptional repressor [Lachnospiraceae bacterium]NCC00048.1 transcriptional repressor [Clostridia bacterium]NCD01892.1 transcriptional repressor [Clostridia bacterium]
MWSSEDMIQELRNRGKRITKQRKIMVDVIAAKRTGDFKEIYYEISKKDPAIGQATVYRMLLTLEEIGAIQRIQGYVVNDNYSCISA